MRYASWGAENTSTTFSSDAIFDLGAYPPGMSTHSVGSVPINTKGTTSEDRNQNSSALSTVNCLLNDTRINTGIENNAPKTIIANAALVSRVRHGSSLRTGVEAHPR